MGYHSFFSQNLDDVKIQHLPYFSLNLDEFAHSEDYYSYVIGFRGSRKLKVGEYSFTRNKSSGNKVYWSCARAGLHKCCDAVEFSLGQRGCTLLMLNGYSYVKNRRSGYKTYWICAKKGSAKCRARVVTTYIDGLHKIVLRSLEHNHPIIIKRKPRNMEKLENNLLDIKLKE